MVMMCTGDTNGDDDGGDDDDDAGDDDADDGDAATPPRSSRRLAPPLSQRSASGTARGRSALAGLRPGLPLRPTWRLWMKIGRSMYNL